MRRVRGRKNLVLLAALLLVAALAVSEAGGMVHFPLLRSLLVNVLAPVDSVLSSVGNAAGQAGRMLGSIMYVYEENETLKKEIADLRRANMDAAEIWAENGRLRELLNFKKSQRRHILLPAKVVGFNPGGLEGSLIIERGKKDGIEREMSVVTANGLVGSVVEVYRASARVQLMLHPKSAVGGIVQRPASRVSGIVSGNASTPFAPNLLNLARDADIVVGDTILTSGLGSIYPKGIVIGVVAKVVNAEGGLLKYAVIEPTVDFSRLEEVMVIVNAPNYAETGAPPEKAVAER
ncbi:MAG: rod shape-determining protein MreC [Acidaminococcales bacterium]|jgi:rod shape-determining protein MreC|nr:rod shape-determining protein MreC [Acidaminococcales bacterium]